MTRVPKKFRAADLEKYFGPDGMVALAEKIREDRKAPKSKKAVITIRAKGEDYPIALAALEGRVTRESMVSLRQTALAFALTRQDEFAGWLEEQTVAIETADGEPETPEGDEPEPAPLEAQDDDSIHPHERGDYEPGDDE